jgi:PA domain
MHSRNRRSKPTEARVNKWLNIPRRLRLGACAVTCAAFFGGVALHAATLVLVNGDAPNTGFNDPTPVAPVGGNPGTTLGQQRQIAFNFVLGIWGKTLSNTNINVEVLSGFIPRPCNANGGVLASAGPNTIYFGTDGTKFANTWYPGALANKLAGRDLDVENLGENFTEIVAVANVNIGASNCIAGSGWYYGIDEKAPADGFDYVKTMLHEVGHGLGFLSLVDEATGEYFEGLPSVWEHFLKDTTRNKTWVQMDDAERQASATNNENLVWTGFQSFVAAQRTLTVKPQLDVFFTGVSGLNGFVYSAVPGFGLPEGRRRGSGLLALFGDGTAPDEGCSTYTGAQASAVRGKVAVVARGGCALTQKVENAQIAGASGVLLTNNSPEFFRFTFGVADERTIRIPVALISQQDGAKLRAGVGRFATVSFIDQPRRAGTDLFGRPLMFAPTLVDPGSSVSHWNVSASPNLVMEPFAVGDESNSLKPNKDLTYSLLQDIGW